MSRNKEASDRADGMYPDNRYWEDVEAGSDWDLIENEIDRQIIELIKKGALPDHPYRQTKTVKDELDKLEGRAT